jgi:hypothetical protein
VSPLYPSGQLHEVVNFDKSLKHSPPFQHGLFLHGSTKTKYNSLFWLLHITNNYTANVEDQNYFKDASVIIIMIKNNNNNPKRTTNGKQLFFSEYFYRLFFFDSTATNM